MQKALVMKTRNDLVALIEKMDNMMYAAASIEKKVMVGEAEVRRPRLLTLPFGTNPGKHVPLFPKNGTAKAMLLDDNKIQGFALNENFYHLGGI